MDNTKDISHVIVPALPGCTIVTLYEAGDETNNASTETPIVAWEIQRTKEPGGYTWHNRIPITLIEVRDDHWAVRYPDGRFYFLADDYKAFNPENGDQAMVCDSETTVANVLRYRFNAKFTRREG